MEVLLILISLIAFIIIVFLLLRLKKANQFSALKETALKEEINNLKVRLTEQEIKISELELRNKKLSVYEPILDVELTIREMLTKAENEAANEITRAKSEAFRILKEAEERNRRLLIENIDLEETVENAKRDLNIERKSIIENAKKEADDKIRYALNESNRILDEAKNEAEKIAGDALIAMKNSTNYERAIKSMKNIIEGYGNKYILPSYSLLDDLAQEFSYTEAGKELLAAKDRTRLLIEEDLAAECDYVEKNRSTTAIQFVIDAFNGKVDSILTRVKKDNYGILSQKIKDAFSTVNYLGAPFRNARIKDEFLNARLNELKWACTVVELKELQKEEQRQIREQIREEEKARREYEKAIKEAEKEEALLKKLIEKAQAQVSNANEAQKLKLQEQLSELEEKLRIAEEKNQRAISMAQQTRAGHVYIISNIGSFGDNVYKIGMTRRLEPTDRIYELSNASVPFSFDIHAMIYSDDAPSLELALHKEFRDMQMNKVNSRKEFFKVDLTSIKNKLDELDIKTSWTMLAEAKQYFETLSIEEAIKRDAKLKEEWQRNQDKQDEDILSEED